MCIGGDCNEKEIIDLLKAIRECACNPAVLDKLEQILLELSRKANENTLLLVVQRLSDILTELDTKATEATLLEVVTKLDQLLSQLQGLEDLLIAIDVKLGDIIVQLGEILVQLAAQTVSLASIDDKLTNVATTTKQDEQTTELVNIKGLLEQLRDIELAEFDFEELLFADTCNANAPIIRRTFTDGSVEWQDTSGVPIPTPNPSCYVPIATVQEIQLVNNCYHAAIDGVDYLGGDRIQGFVFVDVLTQTVVATVYYNTRTRAIVAPSGGLAADLISCDAQGAGFEYESVNCYRAITGGAGYLENDEITKILVYDRNDSFALPVVRWYNQRSGLYLGTFTPANFEPCFTSVEDIVSPVQVDCGVALVGGTGWILGDRLVKIALIRTHLPNEVPTFKWWNNRTNTYLTVEPPSASLKACEIATQYEYELEGCWKAVADAIGKFVIGDKLVKVVVFNQTDTNETPEIKWLNLTTGEYVLTPPMGSLAGCEEAPKQWVLELSESITVTQAGAGAPVGFTGITPDTKRAVVQLQLGTIRYTMDASTPTNQIGFLRTQDYGTFMIDSPLEVINFKAVGLGSSAVLMVSYYKQV
jgi:hypothetical protein